MSKYTIPSRGIVAYAQDSWKLEDLLTREPSENEFLVEMVATGLCHTDILGYGGIYPRVLGHEGQCSLPLNHSIVIYHDEQAPAVSSHWARNLSPPNSTSVIWSSSPQQHVWTAITARLATQRTASTTEL